MRPVSTISAPAIALGDPNIDTDRIIPARYLKAITRKGLGQGAFEALRQEPGNPIDEGLARGARILVAGDNFGCGSSREHAAWALLDLGIEAVIAPSFADIFASNAFKNGLLTVTLPAAAVDRLLALARQGHAITIDLENQTVTTPFEERWVFAMDPFRRHCLLQGLDEIALTLAEEAAIAAHEARAPDWVAGAARD
ncbi:3-isopropylmalate dehydratase small subunit [Thermaurantiacus sp.]